MNVDVYISNISEDVWSFIDTLQDDVKKIEIEENAYLSDRELLTLDPTTTSIIIFPVPLDPVFVEYYKKVFNYSKFDVWVPMTHTGEVCVDIQADQDLWQKLVDLGREHTLVMKSYSASAQFMALVLKLRTEGCSIITPESPENSADWTVNYFGSKSGVRQTTAELADGGKWMTKGAIAFDIPTAVGLATDFYIHKGGVVIKTNKAHSGAGVVIIPPNKISTDRSECEKYFIELFNQEKYWQKFPIVIEEFLDIDVATGGGNPNCEFRIDAAGNVQLLYICGMRVTDEGVFKGVEVASTIFDDQVTKKLTEYGQALGKKYYQAGYRGYYDVDCIYTTTGELLVTESNVRRTGGTHVFHAGNILLGSTFLENYYLLSNNTHPLSVSSQYTFSSILDLLQPLLFSRDIGEGIILASANILKQQKLSHIIVGKNKDSAFALEAEMERLLQSI